MYDYTKIDSEDCDFVPVIGKGELQDGERLFIEIDQLNIVLFNIAGEYFAISDVCTHDDGPLGDGDLDGFQVACPRHGARFDVRDGRALSLPAVEPTKYFPTRIVDNQIEIGIPSD